MEQNIYLPKFSVAKNIFFTEPSNCVFDVDVVKATELVDMVTKSCEAGDDMKTARLIHGALKQLKQSRIKPDLALNTAIATIARDNPKLFATPEAIEVNISFPEYLPNLVTLYFRLWCLY